MLQLEAVIQRGIVDLIEHLDKKAQNAETVDMSHTMKAFAFDVSALISCGHAFKAIENGDSFGLMEAVRGRGQRHLLYLPRTESS